MDNNRAIWLLLFANSVSGVAQGISMIAVPWYFTGILQQTALFGSVYFAVTLASLFWGLYAGTLIDRYNRKHIFLTINASGLLLLSGIAGMGYYQSALPWWAVAAVFGITVFVYNIHYPNLYAYAQEITPKSQYGRVTSLLEIQGQITFTLAGGLAAILLNGVGSSVSFFGDTVQLPFSIRAWHIYEIFTINALAYAVAFAIIYRIQSLPVAQKRIDTSSLRERLFTGMRYLRKHPLLFHFGNASLLVFLTIMIFSTYISPSYVANFLQQQGDVYALGDMAFSAGALLAGFLTTRIFGEHRAVRGIIILSALAGLMYALMMGSRLLSVFFAAQFVIGACNAAVRIQRVTYMFHHIPNHIIGRTGSLFFVVNVVLRLLLIGLFSLPLFGGQAVIGAVGVLALVCFAGALILLLLYRPLMQQPVVE